MNNGNQVRKINNLLKKINKLVGVINDLVNEYDKDSNFKDDKKFGSICYRKDGRYMGRFSYLGKTYYVYDYSKQNCLKKLEDKYVDITSKQPSHNSKSLCWKTWVDQWWINYKTQVIKESTQMIYKPYMELIANDETLRNKCVNKILDIDLLRFINNLPSNKQKKTCHMLLKDICLKAVKNGYMKYDMSCFVLKINETNNSEKKKALEENEIKICKEYLLDYNIDIYDWFIFTLNTGVRIGESLALTWNDIDFDNKIIHINKAYNQVTKKITTPKTNKGQRVIPLFKHVELLLLSMEKDTEMLFNINIQSIKNAFENIYRNYNIKVSPHMLRHTFATMCFKNSVNGKVVQEWLGHDSIQTTQDIYQHVNSLNLVDTSKMSFDTFN